MQLAKLSRNSLIVPNLILLLAAIALLTVVTVVGCSGKQQTSVKEPDVKAQPPKVAVKKAPKYTFVPRKVSFWNLGFTLTLPNSAWEVKMGSFQGSQVNVMLIQEVTGTVCAVIVANDRSSLKNIAKNTRKMFLNDKRATLTSIVDLNDPERAEYGVTVDFGKKNKAGGKVSVVRHPVNPDLKIGFMCRWSKDHEAYHLKAVDGIIKSVGPPQ